jgi:glycosyltransferase involved in cell wall biosynthesis
MTIELSLIVPAFNESARLSDGYARLAPVIAQLNASSFEVIVIDDGSTDGTLQRAGEIYGHLENKLFVQQPANLGKGAALRLGMSLARGTNVVTVDADMAIDPSNLFDFCAALKSCDVVAGSRSVDGHITYDKKIRTLAGSTFSKLVRHYAGTSLRDTQCGMKGYQKGSARILSLLAMVDRFAFDAEILFLANQLGLNVQPLSVGWNDVGETSVRLRRDVWPMLRDIRAFRSTKYENPVVELSTSVTAEEVSTLAREARMQGLVLARSEENTLLVLGRNDALGGLGIATALNGSLRTTKPSELIGRSFEAV